MKPPGERSSLAIALGAVLLAFVPMLLSGRAFVGFDHAIEYFPAWVFNRASILRAELPLWDPRAGAGTPLLAALFSGSLDPVRWVFFPLPAVFGYTLHVVFLHVLAAWGAFRLARLLGVRPWVAGVAAVLMGLGGPLRSLAGFEKELASAAWVPWLLAETVLFARAESLRGILRTGALVALMVLAGGPEYALAGGALFAASVARSRATAAFVLVVGVLAFLLSVGVLVPGFELSRLSTRRSGVELQQVYAHATHPLELVTLLLPGIWGSSAHEWRPLGAAIFDQSYFMPVLFAGLHVLLVPLARFKTSRATRWLGLVLLFSVWCALGERAGLFKLFMEGIPPLRVFRYAYKAWAFAGPALAVLAALGLERVIDEGISPRVRRILLGVSGLGALLSFVGLIAFLLPEVHTWARRSLVGPAPMTLAMITLAQLVESAWALAIRGMALMSGAAALAFAANPRSKKREAALALLTVLGLLDLAWVTHDAQPTIDAAFYKSPPAFARFFAPSEGAAPLRLYSIGPARIPRIYERSYDEGYWEFDKESLRPNLATVWGLEQLHNYDPGKLVWMNRLEGELVYQRAGIEQDQFLASLGVELAVSQWGLSDRYLERIAEIPSPDRFLFRLKGARPRYEVVARVERLPTHEAVLERLGKRFDRIDVLLLREDSAWIEDEDWKPIDAQGRLADDEAIAPLQSAATTIKVVSSAPRRVELELLEPAKAGSYLLARDAFEPRWKATVDGVPTKVERADFCFRAVALPEGARRVVFEYDATLARVAFAIQAAAWLAWLGLYWWIVGTFPRTRSARNP